MLAEGLALDSSELELEGGRRAGSVSASEGSGAPWRTTTDFRNIGELGEGLGISKGNVDDSVVCHGRHSGNDRALLSTTRGTGRDEDTGVFAIISTGSPLAASGIPERLPLSWEVTITGGNANEERIVALEGLGIDDWDIGGLGRSVHLGQDFLRESLGDLIEIGLDAGLLETFLLSFGKLLDVSIHGVKNDGDFGSHFGGLRV